ncbi:unnamed protein product [Clonostachys rosea f. rosea IK726]|uniref:Uncharacterized protein n=1 Tax=Clonostachys rosea f. rosea IK726 TaxID=1349383 RepID=A0ACA9UDC1_BIOOC|nr:unnamed protein product [Clonostachys rosea f. rosea IK726]
MSSEFDRDMDFFQYFHGDDQERFDFNEYCNTGDYTIDQALEAHTLDHPAADASNVFFDPDASVGVLEPNQASLHEGQSAMLPDPTNRNWRHLQFKHSRNHDRYGNCFFWVLPAAVGHLLQQHNQHGNFLCCSARPPYKCTEANCRSKAQYKTLSQFRQHVRNTHHQPLLCTRPSCTHRRPFGKESDLDQHVRSKHEATISFFCGDESCPAHVDGFKRKDKLLKHLREDHPQVQCTKTHCSATAADLQQQSHMEEAHGPFECALGHCRTSLPSNFTRIQLERHLKGHHKMSYDCIVGIRTRMMSDLDVRSEHLLRHPRKSRWEKCSICELGGVTAPINGAV